MSIRKARKIMIITADRELSSVIDICFEVWGYEIFFEKPGDNAFLQINKLSPDVIIVDSTVNGGCPLSICDELKDDMSTINIPVVALLEKKQLHAELFKLQHGVDDYLVKPPNPLELRIRLEMAMRRSQRSFYANPLTGLPGGNLIEDALNKKFESGRDFVTGHIDIDNFKAFNDRYGYLQGDRVIMQVAHMLTMCVEKWGSKGDFVGHIGGDDFVVVTTPSKYNAICENFICMFDTIIRFHYSAEDRKNGYISAKDRAKGQRKVPLMTVTIALVIKNNPGEVNTLIEMNERVAEVKQYLKKISGSKYMADRRILRKDDRLKVQVFQNDQRMSKKYKPLGQILLENGCINRERLDEALKTHWKRGGFLGKTLEESGVVSGEKVSEALLSQYNDLESVVSKNVKKQRKK